MNANEWLLAALAVLAVLIQPVTCLEYGPFEVWKESPHNGCGSFDGCLTMEDRKIYLDPTSPSIPCGFMAPSDLDRVREYFKNDHVCKIVVYSLIFGAYNYAYNPVASKNYMVNDTSICFFLFVDRETMMNGHGIKSLFPEGQNPYFSPVRSVIRGGPHSWQLILLENHTHSTLQHSMKAVKLSGPQLFPNAEWIIHVDTKYVIRVHPRDLVDYADKRMGPGSSMTTFAKFYQSVEMGFKGARHHIMHRHYTYKKNPHIQQQVEEIDHQLATYRTEGLLDVYGKKNVSNMLDAAILIVRNDYRSQRFFCAWQCEVSKFSIRDQLSYHMVEWKQQFNNTRFWEKEMLGKPNLFFQGLRGMPSHPPKWNMFNESNPFPSSVQFHPYTNNSISE